MLAAREHGAPLVNIAQVFAFSGMRQLAFKTSGIRGVADLRGRKVAVWFGGNEFPLLVTLEKYRIDSSRDLTLVQQPFDMNLLLQKRVDAVLDAGVKADDLVVIDFNKEGTAMPEDSIFAQRTRPGRMDPDAFKRTADIALKFGVIRKPAEPAAYTHAIWDLAEKKR